MLRIRMVGIRSEFSSQFPATRAGAFSALARSGTSRTPLYCTLSRSRLLLLPPQVDGILGTIPSAESCPTPLKILVHRTRDAAVQGLATRLFS